jgi:epsin
MDEERLRTERANRGSWKSRVTGLEDMGAMGGYQGEPSAPSRENRQRARTHENDDNDLEFRLALEASKNEADEASKRKPQGTTDNDDDLAKALKLSREEEELRKREQDDQNQANLLFDDTPAQAPQPTGFNQGYQQQAAVDWFGNPVQQQQQQPQQTGYLNNAYNQPTGMQPQQTGFQNGYGAYGYQQQQPQQTGFQQQQSLQPQNTYNPWAQQMNGFGQQQQQQQQQPIQEQQTATPGSNNPWAVPAQSQTPIGVQPTGSNNPFATHRPPQSTTPKAPTLSSLQEQQTSNQFNQRVNPIANFSPSPAPQQQPAPIQQQNTQDPYQSRLNALLASGEGQDTFGNTGDMRLPAQHTAPGTFVNSAGAGSMGRLEAAKTGNNPFFTQGGQQQPLQGQYTGMPATQFPAQTGFGASQGNNPFGARPGQQGQQQQQQGGGSLIDL